MLQTRDLLASVGPFLVRSFDDASAYMREGATQVGGYAIHVLDYVLSTTKRSGFRLTHSFSCGRDLTTRLV